MCFALLYRVSKQRFLAKILILKAVMSIRVWEMWGEIALAHLPLKQGGRALLGWPRQSPAPASVTKEIAPRQSHSVYKAWCLGVQAPAHARVRMRTRTHTWLCPLYPQIIIPSRAKKTTLRLWSSSKYKPHCAKGWCRVTSAFHPKETECHDTLASLLFFLCFPWSLLRS